MKVLVWSLLSGLLADSIESFQHVVVLSRKPSAETHSFWSLPSKRDSLDDEEAEVEGWTGIPQLPAFGASSFSNPIDMDSDIASSSFRRNDENNSGAAFASPKFKLQYTCNVCDTRNSHMVSRLGKMM
jgi:hypothetical protein